MSQKTTSTIEQAVPQRLATIAIILSFAIAAVTLFAKFTGPYWHPDSGRWGPVFTVYGYTLNSITIVFLIGAAILLYAVMLWATRFRLPEYFLILLHSILFTVIFYFLRSNVKIGDGIFFTMQSTVGILHYKEALGTYIMHIAFVLFGPLGMDPHQSIVLLYTGMGGVTAALTMAVANEMMYEHKEWVAPTLFFTISQFGVLQEIVGDVEIYASFMFGLMVYVYVCLKALRKDAHPIIPALAFGILFCIYSASIFLLPSLLIIMYILINHRKRTLGFFQRLGKTIGLAISYMGIGIGIPYALLYGGVMKNLDYIISSEYGGIVGFVALDRILSYDHMMVVLSMQFLLQPSVWGVMLTVWLALFALLLARRLRFKQILKDLVFDSRSIFLLLAFIGLFCYSIIWNIYESSFIWPNEFLTSWHAFSGLVVPGALLVVFWLVRGLPLDRFKKHIIFFLWILMSLVHTLPLVWWNHVHKSVDFANFINPSESSIMLEKDLKLVAELDVGDPKSEKRFNYHIGKTECTPQVRFPPGGRFTFDYYVLNNVCRDGLLLPIPSMSPSFASIVDKGRLSLEGESFDVNIEPGKDLFIVTRMHVGLGQQKIQISIGNQVLSKIDPQGIYIYKRYHYNNPVFVAWPVEFEWQYWKELIFFLSGSKVTGGLTRVSILNKAQDRGYGSYHYFVYQRKSPIQPKPLVRPKNENLHLFNLRSFEDAIMGGNWRRVESDKVPIGFCNTDPGYNTIFYQNSSFGGTFFVSLSLKESWVDRICFLASNQHQRVLLSSFVTSLIFGDDTEGDQQFHLLFNKLVHKRRKSGRVKGIHLAASSIGEGEGPQLFHVMSVSYPSVLIGR